MVLKNFIIWLDSSERTNIVFAVFQGLATAFIGIYNFYPDTQNKTLCIFGFLFFQILVLLFFISLILFSWKYRCRAIRLWLTRDTGVLTDLTTQFRNVSLRSDTLNIILGSMDTGKAYEIGKKAGTDFFSSYVGVLQRDESYSRLKIVDRLKKWLDYDSTSGIGKFEIHSDTGFIPKLKISSPFWGEECPKTPNPQCKFLMGYVDGLCSALYKRELKSKCEPNSNASFCVLTVEEK